MVILKIVRRISDPSFPTSYSASVLKSKVIIVMSGACYPAEFRSASRPSILRRLNLGTTHRGQTFREEAAVRYTEAA